MNTCKIDGCNLPVHGHGLCKKHYRQIKEHGKILTRTHYTKNSYRVDGNVAYIDLYDKYYNIVAVSKIDTEDLEYVLKEKWSIDAYGYAQGDKRKLGTLGSLHRYVMRAQKGVCIDHINMDRLDNRKSNLREATISQNLQHRGKPKSNTSGFCGVSLYKATGKWCSYIRKGGKKTHIGYFSTKEEAALAYNEAAIKMHGEFAFLNRV